MRPLREHFLGRLVEEASLMVFVRLHPTFVALLQIVGGLLECTEGVSDVLGGLGRAAQVQRQTPHLLMKVYVAFLGRGRYPYHPLINLITDTVDIGNAQIDLALGRHQLVKRNHFLLLQHGCLFCTVLLVFSLRKEGHEELVTA